MDSATERDTMYPDEQIDRYEEKAYALGKEHGASAASWHLDGNTDDATYAWVLKGLAECDPAVFDTFPASPLSGEWADGMSMSQLAEDIGYDHDGNPVEVFDGICQMYEDGYDVAVARTIEAAARANAWTEDAGDERYSLNGVAWYVTARSPDGSQVRATMVGDDATHVLNTENLTLIAPEDYCRECGQIGCTANVYA
jgi:hypothetical protein